MATEEIMTLRWRCDRGDCTTAHNVEMGKLPSGYTGTVTLIASDGSPVGEAEQVPWYACRSTHVRGAIETVTSPDEDSPDEDSPDEDSPDEDSPDEDSPAGEDGDDEVSELTPVVAR